MYMSFVRLQVSYYVTSEFTRKTRSILNEFARWKGVEYRFWGLYYDGLVLLKDYVGPEFFKHYLQFVC